MSLDWNISKVEDWEKLQEDETQRVITEGLIFYCLHIGMSGITGSNVEEFFQRVLIYDSIREPLLLLPDESNTTHDGVTELQLERRSVSLAEIQRRIGLSTNVTQLTRNQFLKKIVEPAVRSAEYQLERQKRELDNLENVS